MLNKPLIFFVFFNRAILSPTLKGKYVFEVEVFVFFVLLLLSSWAESRRAVLFELVSNTNSGALS